MENLLEQFKQSLKALIVVSYKIYIFCKEKLSAFIEMLKRVFKPKNKLN